MLKLRIIPVLTFNGLGLVKTKQFKNPRMVGNPIQAARVFNSRGVDELAFVDINASVNGRPINLKLVHEVIKECFMPVSIGGGIKSLEDINDLLKIGADKVIIKSKAITDVKFIEQAVNFFGSQCISIAIDAYKKDDDYYILNEQNPSLRLSELISEMNLAKVGEFVVNSVDNDGMMNGFDTVLMSIVERLTNCPIIAVGGAGNPNHFADLLEKTSIEAVGASSIYHFTQHTPNDVKQKLHEINKPVRLL